MILEEGTFREDWSPGLQNARMERGLSEIKLGCLGKWRTWRRKTRNPVFLAWSLLVELGQKTMALRPKECFLALDVALAISDKQGFFLLVF